MWLAGQLGPHRAVYVAWAYPTAGRATGQADPVAPEAAARRDPRAVRARHGAPDAHPAGPRSSRSRGETVRAVLGRPQRGVAAADDARAGRAGPRAPTRAASSTPRGSGWTARPRGGRGAGMVIRIPIASLPSRTATATTASWSSAPPAAPSTPRPCASSSTPTATHAGWTCSRRARRPTSPRQRGGRRGARRRCAVRRRVFPRGRREAATAAARWSQGAARPDKPSSTPVPPPKDPPTRAAH